MTRIVNRSFVVDNFLRSVAPEFYTRPNNRRDAAPTRRMAIDVRDLGNAYQIDAELPGLSRDAIKVSIEGKVVTLTAQYAEAPEPSQPLQATAAAPSGEACELGDGAKATAGAGAAAVAAVAAGPALVLHTERGTGKASRVVQLPVEVDAALAKARYENGVLTLSLPKLAKSAVQQLHID